VPRARAPGLSPVTQALPLNYTSLKRHVLASPSPTAPPQVAGTGLVEVSVTPWTGGPQWVIQLEDQIGSKRTLRLAAGGSAEALARAQGLWRYRYLVVSEAAFPGAIWRVAQPRRAGHLGSGCAFPDSLSWRPCRASLLIGAAKSAPPKSSLPGRVLGPAAPGFPRPVYRLVGGAAPGQPSPAGL